MSMSYIFMGYNYVNSLNILQKEKAVKVLSPDALSLIYTCVSKYEGNPVITYKEFYNLNVFTVKKMNKLRRELEEKGFIESHDDVNSNGDLCEFTFLTRNIPHNSYKVKIYNL